MDTFLNDLFHAQPNALLVIAGLVFLAISIVGSVKTYFDPGKNGRIAAGVAGALLLIVGLVMSRSAAPAAPAAPSTSSSEAVAQSGSAPGAAANACYVPGKWPQPSNKQMAVGSSCTNAAGEPGQAVVATQICTYTSGPKAGTSEKLNHQMFVGFHCVSPDKQSKGSALAPAAK
jgi:hypothetical protein